MGILSRAVKFPCLSVFPGGFGKWKVNYVGTTGQKIFLNWEDFFFETQLFIFYEKLVSMTLLCVCVLCVYEVYLCSQTSTCRNNFCCCDILLCILLLCRKVNWFFLFTIICYNLLLLVKHQNFKSNRKLPLCTYVDYSRLLPNRKLPLCTYVDYSRLLPNRKLPLYIYRRFQQIITYKEI